MSSLKSRARGMDLRYRFIRGAFPGEQAWGESRVRKGRRENQCEGVVFPGHGQVAVQWDSLLEAT